MTLVNVTQSIDPGQATDVIELQTKSFKDCTLQFLEKTFHLEEVKSLPALEQWLNLPADISEFERQQLLYLHEILAFNVHDWNEYELALYDTGRQVLCDQSRLFGAYR